MPAAGSAMVTMASTMDLSRQHLGRTGAATPPPSAPWMMSSTAIEVLRQPTRVATLSGTFKASSTRSPAKCRTWPQRRPRPEDTASKEVTLRPGAFVQAGTNAHSSMLGGSSSSSNSLPMNWRRTWSDAGAFPSPTLRKADDTIAPERDLSTPARRANHVADHKMRQYAELTSKGRGGSDNSTNRNSSALAFALDPEVLASHKERANAFNDDAVGVENLIYDLVSHMGNGVKNSKEKELERQAALREEARRLNAAEERLARKKEAAARDPHKKVNLKVENTRKFGMAFLDEMCVPMQQVGFSGHAGVQHVNMVDVLSIRQKCKQIDSGVTPTVESLIEEQTRLDRLRGVNAKTGKAKAASTGDLHWQIRAGDMDEEGQVAEPASASSGPAPRRQPSSQAKAFATTQPILMASRSAPLVTLTEGKRAQIDSIRSQKHLASIANRVDKMRSSPSEMTMLNLESMQSQTHKIMTVANLMNKPIRALGFLKAIASEEDGNLRVASKDCMEPIPFANLGRVRRRNSLPKNDESPKAKKVVKVVIEVDPVVRATAMRALATFRYAVSVVVLWRISLKKREAMDRMRSFVDSLGEWSRMRNSIARLKANVKILQRACRHFLVTKRKRCEVMSKEWQRLEDVHLSSHFANLAAKSIEEEKFKDLGKKEGPEGSIRHKRAKQKLQSDKVANEISSMMMDQIDWKAYRIPAKERRATIARYYIVQLKKKIKQKRNLLECVEGVVKLHQETLGFLKEFGADESQALDLKDLATEQMAKGRRHHHQVDFWHLSEDRTLDLIAFAAHQLPKEGPWRDHPANQEISGMSNPMYRPRIKATSAGRGKNDFFGMMGDDHPGSTNHKRRNSTTRIQLSKEEEKKAEQPVDLDELWKNFTPRFLEEVGKPLSRISDRGSTSRPESRPGLGDQDQASWHLRYQDTAD